MNSFPRPFSFYPDSSGAVVSYWRKYVHWLTAYGTSYPVQEQCGLGLDNFQLSYRYFSQHFELSFIYNKLKKYV